MLQIDDFSLYVLSLANSRPIKLFLLRLPKPSAELNRDAWKKAYTVLLAPAVFKLD